MLEIIKELLNNTVYLLIGLAVAIFLFGLLKYITSESVDKREEAIKTITNGIIILFVMISVWGLVNIIRVTFSLTYLPGFPEINIRSGSFIK